MDKPESEGLPFIMDECRGQTQHKDCPRTIEYKDLKIARCICPCHES